MSGAILLARKRASASAGPPAANGTTMRTGLVGQDWVENTDEPNTRLIESTLDRVHFKVTTE